MSADYDLDNYLYDSYDYHISDVILTKQSNKTYLMKFKKMQGTRD